MKKDIINIDQLLKIEIRVGEVIEASLVESSNKLIELTVDFGTEIGIKKIYTAMKKWYLPADFISNKFLFVVNLEPKKMLDKTSEGMILAVNSANIPTLIKIDKSARNGDEVI